MCVLNPPNLRRLSHCVASQWFVDVRVYCLQAKDSKHLCRPASKILSIFAVQPPLQRVLLNVPRWTWIDSETCKEFFSPYNFIYNQLSQSNFCCDVVVEYRTWNKEVAGSTHTRSTASNLEQVTNLLCAQANSASYPQRDRKWVVAAATRWRPSVADWGDGVSASCTVGPIVH